MKLKRNDFKMKRIKSMMKTRSRKLPLNSLLLQHNKLQLLTINLSKISKKSPFLKSLPNKLNKSNLLRKSKMMTQKKSRIIDSSQTFLTINLAQLKNLSNLDRCLFPNQKKSHYHL